VHWIRERGYLQNKTWEAQRVVFFKWLPPLSPAFGFRSSGSDQSLHSLHTYLGFHLIRFAFYNLLDTQQVIIVN
jgi:hypothetical protein